MATKQFNGFELITQSALANESFSLDKQKIYFVRTSTGNTKDDGYIYFNGKKYGTGKLSSDAIQTQLTKLQNTVQTHIGNKATVTAIARTTTPDNGNITADKTDKWLSGDAIAKIKTYVDSEDVKGMALTGQMLQLKNKDNAVLAELNVSSFIKDGMLNKVELVDDKTKGKVLKFTWNTTNADEADHTDIEVSEFFHEIKGDADTIIVSTPESGTTEYLKISANTVASVAGVTSGAKALMTGGITQQYVAQEINKLDSGLALSSNKAGAKDGDPYVALTIQQTDGKLVPDKSSLNVNVATGLTKDNAGFVYNNTEHTFTANETEFTKTGLLDAQEVITLLRYNNTNVKNALDYLKGQITTLSGNMLTVTGSDYITVTKGTNTYTVSAATGLTNAINNANSAVQSVNGKSGTSVTISSSDIKLGDKVNGHSTDVSVTTVLKEIYDKLSTTTTNALISVTGSNSISVSEKANFSQTISVKAKPVNDTDKAAGQIEIITTGDTGIYGLLYFGGDDAD